MTANPNQDQISVNNARRAAACLSTVDQLRNHLSDTQVRIRNAESRPHDPLMIAKLPALRRQLLADEAALAAALARHEAILASAARPVDPIEVIAERAAASRAREQAAWKAANDAKAGR